MKTSSFRAGQALILNGMKYRILRILENDIYQLERLKDSAITNRQKSELLAALCNGELCFDGDGIIASKNTSVEKADVASLPVEKQRQIMRRYHYVKELSALSKNDAVIKHLSTAIATVAVKLDDKDKPSAMTVYRWWQRWESCNQELMALAKKPRKNIVHRRFMGVVGEEIHKAIENIYLTSENNTEQAAYDALCHQINILNAARTRPLAKPSRATFYRICARYDKYSVMAARKGKAAADRYFRSTGIGVVPRFILERAEIDHTPLDLIIVDDVTGLPLGRPLVTFVIDRYSRMPLGFEIGFNEASLLSVMAALRHAIMPKSYLKEAYPDIENEWPAHGIPSMLVCDNGLEFHANELRRMCAELNIEIIFCPKKQPHYKGAIERFQGTFNRQVSQRIPGTTFSNIGQRGDYNAVENARVTLTDIKKLIHHWIVDIYNQSKNRMTGKSPTLLWSEGLTLVEPRLPESADLLRLVMAKQETKTLSHEGIQYKGLMYNSSEIAALRIKNNGNAEIKIRVNPVDISSIWVYDEFAGDYIRVPCLYQEYANGLSLNQHETIRKSERLKTKTLIDEEGLLRAKSKLDCLIRDMSHDKKMRQRRKAAKLSLTTVENKDDRNKEKTPDNKNKLTAKDTRSISLSIEIPEFKTMARGGKNRE